MKHASKQPFRLTDFWEECAGDSRSFVVQLLAAELLTRRGETGPLARLSIPGPDVSVSEKDRHRG